MSIVKPPEAQGTSLKIEKHKYIVRIRGNKQGASG